MSNAKRIKIVLVGGQSLVLEGLEVLLRKLESMDVVGAINEVDRETMVAQQIYDFSPDVVVINLDTSEMAIIELLRQVMQKNHGLSVIALSSNLRRNIIDQAIRAGVLGFVLMDSPFKELVHAINTVHQKEPYICPKITSVLASNYLNQLQTNGKGKSMALTEREYEIIRLFSEGRTTKEVGRDLNISPKTVDACRRTTIQKLDINSMAGLVRYAIKTGITEL